MRSHIYIGVADIDLPDLLRQLGHKKIKQDHDSYDNGGNSYAV